MSVHPQYVRIRSLRMGMGQALCNNELALDPLNRAAPPADFAASSTWRTDGVAGVAKRNTSTLKRMLVAFTMIRPLCLLTLFISGVSAFAASGSFEPVDLRCEYLIKPQGIDVAHPRLSWVLKSHSLKRRGLQQSAWQVLVASSEANLALNRGDLWDSGQVSSDQSIQVSYAGEPLRSRQECFWKVRVWDEAGKSSRWSASASWRMGLLQPEDWRGHWIGKDEVEPVARLGGCSWIWFPEGEPEQSAPAETRYFRRAFELPVGRAVRHAELLLASDNEFACAVNGEHAGAGGNYKSATALDITPRLKSGRNVMAIEVKNSGSDPNPAGLVGLLTVQFETGEPLVIPTDGVWQSANTASKQWTGLAYDDSTWGAAKVLGPVGMPPWGEVTGGEDRRLAARMLRKEFVAPKKVARATLYLSGLGLSEAYLNGRKVGDHVLSPALSEYPKRVFYVTHDVTAQIKSGSNALGVWLGNGRFFAPRLTHPMNTLSYGFPKLLLQLEIDYVDGTRETIVSDASWKLTADGPIRANNEYDGEEYDARKEMPGWTDAGFDDAGWLPVQVVSAPGGKLSAQMLHPIRVTGMLKPVSVSEPRPGMFIFDFGQNMVGWCRLKVRGPAGAKASLRFAETCQPDGTLYLDNLRGAKMADIYTLKGKGTEVYEPRFTYHGFRYVEVTGFPGQPTLGALEGCVVNDDVTAAGEFTCSQPTINRIYQNIVWGVRGNYRSIPTDCPQRDERQGWLGDRAVQSKGEAYLFNVAAFYNKWTQDMADAQRDSGSIPDVCPSYWPLYSDNVVWPSSAVIIPSMLLDQYGDTANLARCYPNLVKWIEHMSGYLTNGIITRDTYGDWCVPPEDPRLIHSKDPTRKTAPAILATSYFHHCLILMSRYATLLDKPADAQRFAAQAEQLKTAMNEKFYNRVKGYYDNGSQTACVLPLAFDMVLPQERSLVFDHLVKRITEDTSNHVGTGLVGGQWLNRVLTEGGRPDLVYRFATNTTYPSWGYMVEQGATTVWELWNGDTADPAMNSGNHVMLVGDLVVWFYECLAGIKPAEPGFKRILMKPQPVGDLKFVKATHVSPFGLIASEWRLAAGYFRWKINVPANTSATIWLPSRDAVAIRESGTPLNRSVGVKVLRPEAGSLVCEISSGGYEFEVPWGTEASAAQ